MTTRIRDSRIPPGALRLFLGVFSGGFILSLLAGCAMLLLSEVSGSPLPKAAEDLPMLDTLYLRAYLRLNSDTLRSPSARSDGIFEVHEGESATEICIRLEQEGWIPKAEVACNYLRYSGGDRSIGSGLFLIQTGQSPMQVAESLASGEGKIRTLTVFPGWRLEEIAETLPQSGIPLTVNDFMTSALGRPNSSGNLTPLYAEIPAWASLEGFLLPAEYRVIPGETADHLVEKMAWNFWQALPAGWIAAVESNGLDLYRGTTMASIIQRESMLEEDMPLVASVLYNRLRIGMHLQVDVTVQYAVGFQPNRGGWWANPLLSIDKEVESPYNTFLHEDLPPGPICSSSPAALRAVAYPQTTSYLYFQAACDGSGRINFSETYTQFLANAC
jgi:UPF0755 protein